MRGLSADMLRAPLPAEQTIMEDASVHGLRDRMDAIQLAVAAGAPIPNSPRTAVVLPGSVWSCG
jgi:hypothetical protein